MSVERKTKLFDDVNPDCGPRALERAADMAGRRERAAKSNLATYETKRGTGRPRLPRDALQLVSSTQQYNMTDQSACGLPDFKR